MINGHLVPVLSVPTVDPVNAIRSGETAYVVHGPEPLRHHSFACLAPTRAADEDVTGSALSQIRQIDYTVIFARDMSSMRRFYEDVMEFEVTRELGESWIEFRIGDNVLALTRRGGLFNDEPTPAGALSLQLAFKVSPAEVVKCAAELREKGVRIEKPVTDQPWGHRTLFFRDPDGNVIEIYAEI